MTGSGFQELDYCFFRKLSFEMLCEIVKPIFLFFLAATIPAQHCESASIIENISGSCTFLLNKNILLVGLAPNSPFYVVMVSK